MEGSIADSTTLRIRKQLQCVTNANSLATKSDKVFFDEFLNFQIAKPPATQGHERSSTDPSSLPDPTSLKPPHADERIEDQEGDDHDDVEDESRQADAAAGIGNPLNPLPAVSVDGSSSELESDRLNLATDPAASAVDEAQSKSHTLPERNAVVGVAPADTTDSAAMAVSEPDTAVVTAAESQTIASGPVDAGKSAPVTEPTADESGAASEDKVSQLTRPGAGSPNAVSQPASQPVKQQPHDAGVDQQVDQQADEDQSAAASLQRQSVESTDSSRVERSTRGARDDRREKWYESGEEDVTAERSTVDVEAKEEPVEGLEATSPLAEPLTATDPLESAMGAEIDAPIEAALAVWQGNPAMLAESSMPQSAVTGAGSSSIDAGGSGGSRAVNPSSPTTGLGGASPLAPAGSRTEKSSGAEQSKGDVRELTQQERVRLVQRVARSFSRLGPDGGQITLKLHPPQLGVLNVSVRIEGQTMSAKLQTESSAAREVILENLPVLRERLAEQGIDVSHFQVDVASAGDMDSGQQASNPFNAESRDRSANSQSRVDYRRLSRGVGAAESAAAAAGWPHDGSWQARSLAEKTLDIRA